MKFLMASALLVVCWTRSVEWNEQEALKKREIFRKRQEILANLAVQFKETEILRAYLIAKGFEELVVRTNFVDELGGKQLLLSQVLKIVDASYEKLAEDSCSLTIFSVYRYKSNLYWVLFHDLPHIMHALKEGGWIASGKGKVSLENFGSSFLRL